MLEIGCRTLSVGQPSTSRGFHGYIPWLTREGKSRGRFAFLPVGRAFLGGKRYDTVLAWNLERPICEEGKDR